MEFSTVSTLSTIVINVIHNIHGKKRGGLDVTDLIEAAKSGNKRATLIALRDKLAETIQNCESGRDMASNSKRLMEVMAEIEALPDESQKKISKHDRLKRRNENR